MAALPYIQLYVADYLADTAHLTTEEHGAYLLLIFNYWQRGEPLPDNDAKLSRIARMDLDSWLAIRPMIAEYFMVEDGFWLHKRVESDLSKVREKSTRASEAGKRSAARRSSDDGRTDVQQSFNGCSTDVQQPLNHTDTDTDTDTDTEKNTKSAGKPRHIVKPPDVDSQVWEDFKTLRKSKRSTLTETALLGIEKQAGLAGISLNDALKMCCERGWQGFKADWIDTRNELEKRTDEILGIDRRQTPYGYNSDPSGMAESEYRPQRSGRGLVRFGE